MSFDLESTLQQLPSQPGVYIMKDRRGQVIYVGKAKDLSKRVPQYFSGHDSRAFVGILDKVLDKIDIVITKTEREALILESTYIKRFRPRYNVVLRDDKEMLQLRMDMGEPWPRVEVVRKRRPDGALYFGPYPSAAACRLSLNVLNRHFQLRTCRDNIFKNRVRPCLQYEIHRCPAPCVYAVDHAEYMQHCREAELFLSGKYGSLVEMLREKMFEASERMAFEQAASYRDQILSIEKISEEQKIVQKTPVDQDYFALHGDGHNFCVAALMVREGRLQNMEVYDGRVSLSSDAETLLQIIMHHYRRLGNYPSEIIVQDALSGETSLLEETLGELSGHPVRAFCPRRGTRLDLLETAQKNAVQQFKERFALENGDVLQKIQNTLSLRHYPHRIECYDISNMQAGAIVASMTVFIQGKIDPNRCRKFKIRETATQNDFFSLYEVITRRLQYLRPATDLPDTEPKIDDSFCEMPDVLLIDGGKGQVGAVMQAVTDCGMLGAFDVFGIGKSRVQDGAGDTVDVEHSPERFYFPDLDDPIILPQDSDEVLLLANVRDETHARAIGFHRKKRESEGMHSILDDIEGIGPKKKSLLLRKFGSVKGIAGQSVESLMDVGISKTLANKILDLLQHD